MTLLEATIRARTTLVNQGIQPETAALDADLLARHAAGWDAATWLARRSEPAIESFLRRYAALIERRGAREPVAYIRGVQEFWGRDFVVTPSVLIPRPESELLVEEALHFLANRPPARAIDIGTGTGCLAITLALESPSTTVYAVEISPDALTVARENAARHQASHRVEFIEGAYLGNTPRPVDLVVSNPPYVAERDLRGLAPEVREHEPAIALFGGDDGLRDIRKIMREVAPVLTADGALMIEIGYGQSDRLADEIARLDGLQLVRIAEDLQGIPRVAILRPE